ncbi:hypothetical protein MKW98_031443, partial [Papaver atlanticum]
RFAISCLKEYDTGNGDRRIIKALTSDVEEFFTRCNPGFIRCMVQQHEDPNQLWRSWIINITYNIINVNWFLLLGVRMATRESSSGLKIPIFIFLSYSIDGRFLVSLGGGPCLIWDVETAAVVASLLRENDEVFTSCRFSVNGNGSQILYITTMRDHGGSIVSFDTSSWTRVSSKHVVHDPISAFRDVWIYKSSNTRVTSIITKAHLGLVTALKFSEDFRLLVSASTDSSVKVTKVEEDTALKVLQREKTLCCRLYLSWERSRSHWRGRRIL